MIIGRGIRRPLRVLCHAALAEAGNDRDAELERGGRKVAVPRDEREAGASVANAVARWIAS